MSRFIFRLRIALLWLSLFCCMPFFLACPEGSSENVDGGDGDGGTVVPPDAGAPSVDGGSPVADGGDGGTGVPPADGGSHDADSGTVIMDAGSDDADSGAVTLDAGGNADGGALITPCPVCDANEFCEYPAGTCGVGADPALVICVEKTDLCLELYDPVCGCDGMTYGNDCERKRVGVSLDHEGECGGVGDN